MAMASTEKAGIIKTYQRSGKNTETPEVQIAL